MQTKLPPSLRRVVQLTSEGKNNKAIAEAMNLSYYTIKQYKDRIYKILGLHDHAGLYHWAHTNADALA